MPGPQKTKGALKNTRFKSKMRRHNVTRKRQHAFYLDDLNNKKQQEYLTMVAKFALYISRKLEREGKIKTAETCDGSFDTYYTTDDAWKITQELFEKLTTSKKAESQAHKELQRVKRANPGARINLKLILLLLVACMNHTTEAKWTEWSSPPHEISKYDTIGAGLIGSGLWVIKDALWSPPSGLLGAGMIGCGLVTRGVGSAHRLYDHVTGVHPLRTEDAVTEALGVIVPGSSGVWRGAIQQVNTGISKAIGEPQMFTFERAGPVLGENLAPAITKVGEQIPIYRERSESKRNANARWLTNIAQPALESAIEAAPAAGITALGVYSELPKKY